MSPFTDFDNKVLSPKGKRLLKEWKLIDKLCKNNKYIAYIIRKRNPEGLPVKYEIVYRNINSIVGVEEPKLVKVTTDEGVQEKEVRLPVFGKEHRMEINLPVNYPAANGNPEIYFITDIWHPNIRATGKYKGRVCANEQDLGITTSLAARILRIGQYLQYQMYLAIDIPPHPEDQNVARWVREEAEPMGFINKEKGIFTDSVNLYERVKPNLNKPSGETVSPVEGQGINKKNQQAVAGNPKENENPDSELQQSTSNQKGKSTHHIPEESQNDSEKTDEKQERPTIKISVNQQTSGGKKNLKI